MVKRALLVTLILFGLYTIFIGHFRPYWSISQHQGQDNQIKVEKYLYDRRHSTQNVLVGSSLSCRLDDSLPNVYNLALNGKSALDGLALVTKQAKPIPVLYVEMNVIDRDEDSNFTAEFSNPILSSARQLFMSLRADKQPLAVAGERVKWIVERLTKPSEAVPSQKLDTAATSNSDLFGKMLQNQEESYNKVPDAALFSQRFAKLLHAVAMLEKKGTKVVFYEMPVDYHLCDSPKATAIRRAFYAHFPPAKYTYIPVPDCAQYHTMDGVHLTAESGTKFTKYLQAKMASE